MKLARPCANLFLATKGKLFLIFTMGVGPGGQTLLGEPVEVADLSIAT